MQKLVVIFTILAAATLLPCTSFGKKSFYENILQSSKGIASPSLKKEFQSAESVSTILIECGNSNSVLLVRKLSNPKNPTGFCGSGFEDFLILTKNVSNTIYIKDKILLQSCKKSIVLQDDGGESNVSKLLTITPNNAIEYKMLASDCITSLFIKNDKFIIKNLCHQIDASASH